MRLIVLGPPGSGKGTQSKRAAAALGVPHISTGDMLRSHIAADTDLGRKAAEIMLAGELVPDDLVIAMLTDRIAAEDAADGFILDGFPRNLAQALALESVPAGSIDRVVLLMVEDEEVIRRIGGRRGCSQGHSYHLDHCPPSKPGVCDLDGEPLEQRPDDLEEVIRNRLSVYRHETEPLVDFYNQRGLISEIEAHGSIERITEKVLGAVRA